MEVNSVTPIISAATMAPAPQGVRDQACFSSAGRTKNSHATGVATTFSIVTRMTGPSSA